MNVNVVVIAGNLTRDPELRYLTSGTAVGNFTLALNRVWMKDGQKQEEVSFVKVVVWGKLAETCGQYLFKGSGALVEGHLKQEHWEDKEGGKRERTCVVANRVQFVNKSTGQVAADKPASGGTQDAASEEIPF